MAKYLYIFAKCASVSLDNEVLTNIRYLKIVQKGVVVGDDDGED